MTLAHTPDTPLAPGIDLYSPDVFTNREMSWLEFNQRVLDQATAEYHPLLERVKFLGIVGSNLDEFFMVRVATLLKQARTAPERLSADGMTVLQQLVAIRARAARMIADQAACWRERLRPALAAHDIRFLEPAEYDGAIVRYLQTFFTSEIHPLLTPLAFDPGHPFPLISNRSANFAVVVRHNRRTKFARVKVPPALPRFVPVPGHSRGGAVFAFLEDVIRLNLGALFPGVEVVGAHLFRVIRDTDMELRDVADDLMESIDRGLKELRSGSPSLLHVESTMPRRVLNILVENFEVAEQVVLRSQERLGFADWIALHRLPYPALKDRPFVPRTLWAIAHRDKCLFDDIRERDRLVHHPFDSFSAVEAFIHEAATDPLVVAIKMTLYRIGPNSPLIDMLIAAADAGKQVAVLVELKARFDERNNINWATRLESAGVHVVYGVENLKTHCKLCLVVRKEAHGAQRYAHIATGNYNRATSQVYTDVGLFTADPDVLNDVAEIFNSLTGYSNRRDYTALLVAPTNLRAGLIRLIERERDQARAGGAAHIILKANAVTDPAIIRALYEASADGVEIDLIVRGTCCLRPGVPGLSDRIRVRSVVGRFLEHSRIYHFANGGAGEMYLGSADLMERNLDRRVETLCRIRDATIVRHLRDVVLEAYLRDTDRASLLVDRTYTAAAGAVSSTLSAQHALLEWYAAASAEDDGRVCADETPASRDGDDDRR